MAHRPCLLSVHAPSATAGMTLPLRPPPLHFGMHPAGRAIASKFGRHNSPRRAPTRGGGHPQGVPLPIVFSRRFALRRAPTRGAPTDCLLSAFCPAKGTHKGCPYRLSSLGVWPCEGHPQGVPLPIALSQRFALGRAPTRGAPTDCPLSAFCPGKGTHKGCPYRLPSLGVLPWEGHPQGVPFYRLSSLGVLPCEGHPQGVPLPIVLSRRFALGRAPTRGAPTDCPLSAFCPGKGTHKGCPYRLPSLGVWHCEGHPQGVPLPIVLSRRFALRRAPTRGAPTDCLLSAFCPAKGTHKGCPYRLSSLGVLPCEGHPQGVPLPIVLSRRLALRRAPTRGAPTDCPLSAFCPGKGTHKGCPYPIQAASRGFSNLMQLP